MFWKRYGAGGLGVDIEPELIAIANKSAEENNLEHLVSFRSIITVHGELCTVQSSSLQTYSRIIRTRNILLNQKIILIC